MLLTMVCFRKDVHCGGSYVQLLQVVSTGNQPLPKSAGNSKSSDVWPNMPQTLILTLVRNQYGR